MKFEPVKESVHRQSPSDVPKLNSQLHETWTAKKRAHIWLPEWLMQRLFLTQSLIHGTAMTQSDEPLTVSVTQTDGNPTV